MWPSRTKTQRQAGAVRYASSPLLATPTPPWRSKLLVALLGLGSCVLIGRAAYIQIVGADFYLKQGESRYVRTLELPASRGRILDRNGQLLAASVPAPSLWAIPKDVDATPAQRNELAKLLGLDATELKERLADNANFVWLRRQVDEALAQRVKALGLRGVYQVTEYKRKYPEGEAAAHVVGFASVEEQGQEGIELAYQAELAGRAGTRSVIRDRFGRVVEDVGRSVPPSDGSDVALTVDSKVQFFAYQRIRDAVAQHKAQAGSVVVLDARSGEVLALANYPSYQPGDRRDLEGAKLRNRAVTDTFEPGSTMKPFIAALALQTGRVKPNTVIATTGGRTLVTGVPITDTHAYGDLTVEQVIQKSSNVGVVKIAMQMQPREMWELFGSVGFGQKPQVAFPGSAAGRLRPYKTWRPIEQATMAYGYGLSTSLLQLAHAYTVFAGDGELAPLALVRPLRPGARAEADSVPARCAASAPNGVASPCVEPSTSLPAGPRPQIFTPQTVRAVRKMLQMAAGDGGTAPKAQTMGYSVGGKSGTAHKQEHGGYAQKKFRAWFVGLAPLSDPRIIVAVMVDEPNNGKHFGGDVAAPVFSEVVQQTLRMLGVAPDLEVQEQIVTRPAEQVDESF